MSTKDGRASPRSARPASQPHDRAGVFRARRLSRPATHVELIVSLVIVGVMLAIVMVSVAGFHRTAEATACRMDTGAIITAEQALLARTGAYGDIAALVGAELLARPSMLHGVALEPATGHFVVRTLSALPRGKRHPCGGPGDGAPVDGLHIL